MKRRLILGAIGLSPLALIAGRVAPNRSLVNILLKRWKKSKEYSLAVVDKMPAALIEYTPSEEQMSFAQHFLHLGYINVFYLGILLDSKTYPDINSLLKADFVMEPPDQMNVYQQDFLVTRDPEVNKAMVSKYVAETFDYVIDSLGQINDEMLTQGEEKVKPDFLSGHTNLDLIIRGENHTAHHRAQAISYLRMNGIRPPGYTVNNTF